MKKQFGILSLAGALAVGSAITLQAAPGASGGGGTATSAPAGATAPGGAANGAANGGVHQGSGPGINPATAYPAGPGGPLVNPSTNGASAVH